MKLSTNTFLILKNFSKINPSIMVEQGNVLKTISPSKTILARATVDVDFPKTFCVYNLDRFISTVSLFEDPDLDFQENYVKISDKKRSTKYVYADENTIIKSPAKNIELPTKDVSFKLEYQFLKDVERAANVLGLPEIAVVGSQEDQTLMLKAIDSKNPSGDTYSIELDTQGAPVPEFTAIFKQENIKILPEDFDVTISSRGISHFKSDVVEYWIAVEQNSSF